MAKSSELIGEPISLPDPARAIDAIAELARNAAGIEIQTLKLDGGGLPTAIPVARRHGERPDYSSVKSLAEEWRLFPERKKGTATVGTLESFINLTKRHADDDSAIFADLDWKAPSMTAIIDYHGGKEGNPDWCQHRIHYPFPRSEHWQTWVNMNGQVMKQAEFAAFIEDNIGDLSSPYEMEATEYEHKFMTKIATPSALVSLSRGLQVHVSSRAQSAVTLQSGEGEIVWDEVHNDAEGKKLTVPGIFMLQIPIFHMGEPQRIAVRLRYRVREGAVSWFYQMYRPDIAVTERVTEDVNDAAEETNLPAYIGTDEARSR